MAKKEECSYTYKYKGIYAGIVLVLAGFLLRQGYEWPEILMLIGGLMVLKGMLFKYS